MSDRHLRVTPATILGELAGLFVQLLLQRLVPGEVLSGDVGGDFVQLGQDFSNSTRLEGLL
jgi:hypothetical protein